MSQDNPTSYRFQVFETHPSENVNKELSGYLLPLRSDISPTGSHFDIGIFHSFDTYDRKFYTKCVSPTFKSYATESHG